MKFETVKQEKERENSMKTKRMMEDDVNKQERDVLVNTRQRGYLQMFTCIQLFK